MRSSQKRFPRSYPSSSPPELPISSTPNFSSISGSGTRVAQSVQTPLGDADLAIEWTDVRDRKSRADDGAFTAPHRPCTLSPPVPSPMYAVPTRLRPPRICDPHPQHVLWATPTPTLSTASASHMSPPRTTSPAGTALKRQDTAPSACNTTAQTLATELSHCSSSSGSGGGERDNRSCHRGGRTGWACCGGGSAEGRRVRVSTVIH